MYIQYILVYSFSKIYFLNGECRMLYVEIGWECPSATYCILNTRLMKEFSEISCLRYKGLRLAGFEVLTALSMNIMR
jgi:hypothetical protein